MPHLPIEICERIIDIIGEDLEFTDQVRPNLLACCLTCRDWLPRSRFNLFPGLRLWSKDHLDHITKVLSSPVLQKRVRIVEVISSPNTGDALAPLLQRLESLHFHLTDLSKAHPSFYQFFTLFRTSRETSEPINLWLIDAYWTRFSQVQRLVSVIGADTLNLMFPTDGSVTLLPMNVFTGNHPRASGRRCTPLRFLFVEGKRIEVLDCIPWACLLDANPFLSNVRVSIGSPPTETKWSEWVRLVSNLRALYDRMCLSISGAMANSATPRTYSPSYRSPSRGNFDHVVSVALQYQQSVTSGELVSRLETDQELTLYADTKNTNSSNSRPHTSPSVALCRSLHLRFCTYTTRVNHEDFAVLGKLLGCVMDFADRANHDLLATVDPGTLARLRGFQNVALGINSRPELDLARNFTTEPWISSWSHIDDALSQSYFGSSPAQVTISMFGESETSILDGDDLEG